MEYKLVKRKRNGMRILKYIEYCILKESEKQVPVSEELVSNGYEGYAYFTRYVDDRLKKECEIFLGFSIHKNFHSLMEGQNGL